MNRQLQTYKSNEVSTASKMKLVILMYDGAIRFLKECKKKIKAGDIPGRGLYISRAQKVISELQDSLNASKGGEVASNLARLYNFLMRNLSEANIDADEAKVDESIKVMECLREGWSDVITAAPLEQAGENKNSTRVALHM